MLAGLGRRGLERNVEAGSHDVRPVLIVGRGHEQVEVLAELVLQRGRARRDAALVGVRLGEEARRRASPRADETPARAGVQNSRWKTVGYSSSTSLPSRAKVA